MANREPVTTSATGKPSPRPVVAPRNAAFRTGERGFTVLEILITLGIIVLFSSFFVFQFAESQSESLIRETGQELKKMALQAKRSSFAGRQDQFIVFSGNLIFLTDGWTERMTGIEDLPESDVLGEYLVPEGVGISLRSHSTGEWQRSEVDVWVFRGSGLNDPVEVRITHDRSYMLLEFNALTGIAAEESVYQ